MSPWGKRWLEGVMITQEGHIIYDEFEMEGHWTWMTALMLASKL